LTIVSLLHASKSWNPSCERTLSVSWSWQQTLVTCNQVVSPCLPSKAGQWTCLPATKSWQVTLPPWYEQLEVFSTCQLFTSWQGISACLPTPCCQDVALLSNHSKDINVSLLHFWVLHDYASFNNYCSVVVILFWLYAIISDILWSFSPSFFQFVI
jgi:hypothetical protein